MIVMSVISAVPKALVVAVLSVAVLSVVVSVLMC